MNTLSWSAIAIGSIGFANYTLRVFIENWIKHWFALQTSIRRQKSEAITNAVFLISTYLKSDPNSHRVDFTDEQAYLALRSQIDPKVKTEIERRTQPHTEKFEERIHLFRDEVNSLAKKWKIPG